MDVFFLGAIEEQFSLDILYGPGFVYTNICSSKNTFKPPTIHILLCCGSRACHIGATQAIAEKCDLNLI